MCIGDHNEILSSKEKEARLPRPEYLMQNFRSTLLHCGLIDMGFTGNMFTWENGKEGEAFVQERLDRACATLEWCEPHSRVTNLTSSYSNNVPILLNTQVERHTRRRRKIPNRFEEKWVTHPQCEEIVQQAWTSMQATSSPMYVLFEKIKHCQRVFVD